MLQSTLPTMRGTFYFGNHAASVIPEREPPDLDGLAFGRGVDAVHNLPSGERLKRFRYVTVQVHESK